MDSHVYCVMSTVNIMLRFSDNHYCAFLIFHRSLEAKPLSFAAVDSIKLPLDLSSKRLLLVSLTRSSDVSELTAGYGGRGVPVLGTLVASDG